MYKDSLVLILEIQVSGPQSLHDDNGGKVSRCQLYTIESLKRRVHVKRNQVLRERYSVQLCTQIHARRYKTSTVFRTSTDPQSQNTVAHILLVLKRSQFESHNVWSSGIRHWAQQDRCKTLTYIIDFECSSSRKTWWTVSNSAKKTANTATMIALHNHGTFIAPQK